MDKAELEITSDLEKVLKRKIKRMEKEYIRFDAYDNNNNLYEYKHRHKHYDDVLFEFSKYASNLLFSQHIGYRFLYVVRMGMKTYIFNISELSKSKYDFNFEWKELPRSTEGGSEGTVPKYIGYINIKEASLVFTNYSK